MNSLGPEHYYISRWSLENISFELPLRESVSITFQGDDGIFKKMTIPHPPMRYSDDQFYCALTAALIGLAIRAGIEPEDCTPANPDEL